MEEPRQDSDSSHVDMHESEHSHSSVSSIPVLSTPMMEMDALLELTFPGGVRGIDVLKSRGLAEVA